MPDDDRTEHPDDRIGDTYPAYWRDGPQVDRLANHQPDPRRATGGDALDGRHLTPEVVADTVRRVVEAWTTTVSDADLHRAMRRAIFDEHPVLARALDALAVVHGRPQVRS